MAAGQQLTGILSGGATFTGAHELLGAKRSVVIPFNFSQMAAITDVLVGPAFPIGSVVTSVCLVVQAAFTATVNTAKIGVGFATDAAQGIMADAAVSGAPWSTTGIKTCIPITPLTILACTGNNGLTAERQIQFTRNTGAGVLTAGQGYLIVDYTIVPQV